MSKPQLLLCQLCAIVAALFPLLVIAADNGLTIPRIAAEPGFEDFVGMAPNSVLARSMVKAENFIQREPDDGDPATQRTEVYVGYDQQQFYAIYLAFDSEPSQVRANLSSRENIDGDDAVEMTIDTFNDQRTAFAFRSTPLGIQWDARWTEGEQRRRRCAVADRSPAVDSVFARFLRRTLAGGTPAEPLPCNGLRRVQPDCIAVRKSRRRNG